MKRLSDFVTKDQRAAMPAISVRAPTVSCVCGGDALALEVRPLPDPPRGLAEGDAWAACDKCGRAYVFRLDP